MGITRSLVYLFKNPDLQSQHIKKKNALLSRDELLQLGKDIAKSHDKTYVGHTSNLRDRLLQNFLRIEEGYKILSEAARNHENITPGAEWLLDNYFLIERKLKEIRKQFPKGYDKKLTKIAEGEFKDYPRTYHLAVEFIAHTDSNLEASLLTGFIEGYQTVNILSIGETWSVPIMLQFALVEHLRDVTDRMLRAKEELSLAEKLIEELTTDDTKKSTDILLTLAGKVLERPSFLTYGAPFLLRRLRSSGRKTSLTVQWLEEKLREDGKEPDMLLKEEKIAQAADQISIGNAFTSTRNISFINWKDWFETVNRVEHILRLDPSGVHGESDFNTRDRARQQVEKIARKNKLDEIAIAEKVIEIARNNSTGEEKKSCIGYYLQSLTKHLVEEALDIKQTSYNKIYRQIRGNPFPYYISLISIIAFIATLTIGFLSDSFLALVLLLVFIPAFDLAHNFVQWILNHIVPPNLLPKLEFEAAGIPEKYKTLVVSHGIFTNIDSMKESFALLKVRALANPDSNLVFTLLADLKDLSEKETEADKEIIRFARQLEAEASEEDLPPCYIIFRERTFNDNDKYWMGYERKRGKIEELCCLMCKDGETSFIITEEQKEAIQSCRYVITLDSDTQLPPGSARKMIGAIAHPLNKAVYDKEENRVTEGYAILQPRVGVSLTSAGNSRFSSLFCGHAGLDPYTQSVSDIYQDIFFEASYVGKGIFDPVAFHTALKNKVPENSLLSHDLFEGNIARCGLISDVELFDDFPSKYHVHSRRQHRWVRGDWQLLPWIFKLVPSKNGNVKNYLTGLHIWKLFDNLRRSVASPALLLLTVGAFSFLPGSSLTWLALVLLTVAFPIVTNVAQAVLIPPRGLSFESHIGALFRDIKSLSLQTFLTFCFLPHQAFLHLHAICLTIYRLYFSKKNLLEWETALSTEKRLSLTVASFFTELKYGLFITAIAAYTIYLGLAQNFLSQSSHPNSWPVACLLILCWLFAPVLAWWISIPKPSSKDVLSQLDQEKLYTWAFETWKYFDSFINEKNNYLVPDNVQFNPEPVIAERTSPTNISLSMLATVSACDLGFVAMPYSIDRLEKIFISLGKLEKFNGHFLNWYGTTDLRSLHPRYVSSVDSGNLAGHFIALKTWIQTIKQQPLLSTSLIYNLERKLKISSTSIPRSFVELFQRGRAILSKDLQGIDEGIQRQVNSLSNIIKILHLADVGEKVLNNVSLNEADKKKLNSLLHLEVPTLESAHEIYETIKSFTKGTNVFNFEDKILSDALETIEGLQAQIEHIKDSIDGFIDAIDFTFLYDNQKDLFTIGFNVEAAKRDNSYYDLLASESRLGSFVSIALGQIPPRHWFSLGRGLTEIAGGKTLLSWTGTMFEYLMPLLVMKPFEKTLIQRSCAVAVNAQKQYGQKLNRPWGISESGYAGLDFEKTYQYKAFGVPGLGLKRGLEDDIVVSPYSSFLALLIDPKNSVKNLRALENEELVGSYGFYEAIDYTRSRLTKQEKGHIVKNHLAHHQGMSLIAATNVLCNDIWQERFHAAPIVQANELLLHEKFPERLPTITPHQVPSSELVSNSEAEISQQIVTTPHTILPKTHLLSNGRLTTMLDNAGSGFLIDNFDVSLTRWREDSTSNDSGYYIYIKDIHSEDIWSATYQPTLKEPVGYEFVTGPDKVEYKRRDNQIFSHLEVTISPEESVEIRRLTLANTSTETKVLEITSFGEVALAPTKADQAHPAFSKMFIQSEFLTELDALIFTRRPRSEKEAPMHLLHMVSMNTVWDRTQYDTSREEFFGRGRDVHNPKAIYENEHLSDSIGNILDPIFSLKVRLEIAPGTSETVTFITSIGERDTLISVAQRYKDPQTAVRAFEMAWSQSSIELKSEKSTANNAHIYQKLASALIFPHEKHRGDISAIQKNKLGQQGLWRFGISGDLPICLVRISDLIEVKLIDEAVKAHGYIRGKGFQFDLVILYDSEGSYLQNTHDEIDYIVRSSQSGQLLNKKGGIFIRSTQQLGEDELTLLETVARVVLNGAKGNMQSQLKLEDSGLIKLPKFVRQNKKLLGTKSSVTSGTLKNSYGYFNNSGGYTVNVSSDNVAPLPWSNVIASKDFGFLITDLGGGYTWHTNSREYRLTPWRNDPVSDPVTECVFLRDLTNTESYSLTPNPIPANYEYIVEHNFGASSFQCQTNNITSKLTLTVAKNQPRKWYAVTLSNNSAKSLSLEVGIHLTWVLGVNRFENAMYLLSSYDESKDEIIVENKYSADFFGNKIVVGCTEDVSSFTNSRDEFIGRNRTLSSASMLTAKDKAGNFLPLEMSKKVGSFIDPATTLVTKVTLQPGEKKNLAFYVEVFHSSNEYVENKLQKTFTLFENDLKETTSYFNSKVIPTVKAATTKTSFNSLMNGWLLYQTLSCRLWGRSGFYQSGGAFGFRDQLQDSLAFLETAPELVKTQLLLHATRQFTEGDVQHWWHPPLGKGVRTRITDDFLWLPYVAVQYLNQTKDESILDEELNFITAPELPEHEMEAYIVPSISSEKASFYNHCVRAIERGLKFGPHGLPIIGGGDWNDGMNEVGREGKGESVWLGWFLAKVLVDFAPIAEKKGEPVRAERFRELSKQIVDNIEAHAWDGSWYMRAFFDDGTPLGSHINDECSIDSISQSWAVITGLGNPERSKLGVYAAVERLVDKKNRIIKLLDPPFDKSKLEPGYIKGYLPGIRENGGQYTHAAAWLIIALAKLGDHDKAWELFQLINPAEITKTDEGVRRYKGEPYVLCGDVYSVEPHGGRAGWSWYTGSASWMYQAGKMLLGNEK